MDIKNTDNKCDLKCSFNFNYTVTTVTSLITPNQIMLKLGTPSIKPVKFNDIEYVPTEIYLTYPSITLYNGVKADAEIIIGHRADSDKPLIVKIPIATSSVTKPFILEDVINRNAILLPKDAYGDISSINFNLEDIVPKGPFYYSENKAFHEIYYGLENSLFLSEETMKKFKEIVIAGNSSFPNLPGDLFYNPEGSNLSADGGVDFNFLQCEEYYEEDVPVDSTDKPSFIQKLSLSPTAVTVFWYFLAFIIAGLILYLFHNTIYKMQ